MDVEKKRVLIFPAGSEIGFELYDSLRHNLHVELFGASGKPDHARLLYRPDRYVEDDFYIDRPDFVERFNAVLTEWDIDFVFPTHDSIVLHLAKHREELAATVICPSLSTALTARYKRRIYSLFADDDFCPVVFEPPFDDAPFPLFLKPDDGQGGKGAFLVEDATELHRLTSKDPNLVVCEYLPGDELSVDCFTDRHGALRFVGPRTRERVTSGISFESATVPLTPEIQRIGEVLNERLELRGAWFFQVKQTADGKWKLLEFAARHASTMGVYRQSGVNFALLTLFDAMGQDVVILNNDLPVRLSRKLQSRYVLGYAFDRVYIDFDDTLIVDGSVNVQALAFLYECRNQGRRISLITKHRGDIGESLGAASIAESLFDEILHLAESDEKHEIIEPEGAIFIDNYFFDREKVHRNLDMPVFDVDAVDALVQD